MGRSKLRNVLYFFEGFCFVSLTEHKSEVKVLQIFTEGLELLDRVLRELVGEDVLFLWFLRMFLSHLCPK